MIKVAEEFSQWLSASVYITVFVLLIIPTIAVSATLHAINDMWAICEEQLRTSRPI